MSWSAKQYVAFEDERTRPVRDLLSAVPDRAPKIAVDMGCGPGNSTEVLATQFPGAAISGFDSSSDMIEAARKRMPHVQFDVADIAAWEPAKPVDLILSNAVLQWVPDHKTLLPRLVSKLAQGGNLAVQVPDNLNEPARKLMREVAADGPWADRLANVERMSRESASWHYDLLRPLCSRVDIWRTTYHHPLAGGAAAIAEWFKGSSLRPYLAKLDESEQKRFLDRYIAEVAIAYPALSDGSVLLPFPRLFFVATR